MQCVYLRQVPVQLFLPFLTSQRGALVLRTLDRKMWIKVSQRIIFRSETWRGRYITKLRREAGTYLLTESKYCYKRDPSLFVYRDHTQEMPVRYLSAQPKGFLLFMMNVEVEYVRAVCKVRGLTLLLRVGTSWRCGEVSFSKSLPWQAMHFIQCSTHFSKTCCRPLITSKFLASELPFHGWKRPEIAWDEIWTVCRMF
jgi:hypothetical protein